MNFFFGGRGKSLRGRAKTGIALLFIALMATLFFHVILPSFATTFTATPSSVDISTNTTTTGTRLNFSINNSDLGDNNNIIEINITFNSSVFEYVTSSNRTSNTSARFNDSFATVGNLSWYNTTVVGFVGNGTNESVSFNVTVLDKTHTSRTFTITVRYDNQTLRSSTVTISVNDDIFPEVTITSPSAGNSSSATQNFNATALEHNPAADGIVQVTPDGQGAINYTLTNHSGNWGFTNLSMPDNRYTALFFINDTAGNVNNTEQVIFTVDITVPTVDNVSTTASGSVSVTDTINVTANVTDTNRNDSAVVASGDTGATNVSMNLTTNNKFNVQTTPANLGCSAGTTCTIIVYAKDAAGNLASANTSITIAAAPSPPAPPPSGNGGGGGAPPPSNPKSTTIWAVINPFSPQTVTITNEEIGFTEIRFTTNKQVLNVKLVVEKIASKPADLPDPSGAVFQYLELTATNFDDSDLSGSVKIQFTVSNSWFVENGVSKNAVTLLRYTSQWDELETTLIVEETNFTQYEATTPGFSAFAISTAEEVAAPICGDGVCDATESFESCPADCPAPPSECTSGEKRCLGNSIQICSAGSWQTQQTCTYGCDATTKACKEAPIAPPPPSNQLIIIVIAIVVILGALLFYFHQKKK